MNREYIQVAVSTSDYAVNASTLSKIDFVVITEHGTVGVVEAESEFGDRITSLEFVMKGVAYQQMIHAHLGQKQLLSACREFANECAEK